MPHLLKAVARRQAPPLSLSLPPEGLLLLQALFSWMNVVVREALLQEPVGGGRVRCGTCLRRCVIPPGLTGLCGNYRNVNGRLVNVGYGKLSAIESRPIEIKPLYHFWPGSYAMTFSGWGCNFLCPWCQNWHLSKSRPPDNAEETPPGEVVKSALRVGDDGVCASFNEPTIHLEYLVDVFRLAREAGLYSTMVSNGSLTLEALKLLRDAGLNAMNVDIKGCPETYRKYVGVPNPVEVLRTVSEALRLGIHVEAVYLIVTGANDWDECVEWVIEAHLKYLGEDVPLHINRYYPAYRYFKPQTPWEAIERAYRVAVKEGVKYVYIGNVGTSKYLHTRCPRCGEVLVERFSYGVLRCNLTRDGRCPRCGLKVPIVGECRVSVRGVI